MVDMETERPGADDVTALSVATQDRVVLRLRRGADDAPWITELVCCLFNAQGEVLQVARGAPSPPPAMPPMPSTRSGGSSQRDFFGVNGNLVARRQRAKDAIEKEFVAFSLSKLHSFVEVVGCLVTYAEDEIARSPRLNEFAATCDLCASDGEDDSSSASAAKYRNDRALRAFEYAHDPRASGGEASPNVVVLCKLYRNHKNRSEWLLHTIGERAHVRSAITSALTETMQVFLLDIMPEIEIPNRNALTSVLAVCAALNYDEFLGIERYFPAAGIGKDDFARIVLYALLEHRPELERVTRASALVALLCEMFEQIDINGDAVVDWEEFTTFCMSLGLIATSEQDMGGAGLRATSYRQAHVGGAKPRTFPYQIHKIKAFPQLKRIAVVENKSAVVLVYDADLVLQHEMNGVEKLLGKETEPAILDVDHIAPRNLLAISSSDHSITLWAIVNILTGAYVFASKIVTRFPVVFLKWCSPLKRLLASGAEYAQLWDIDTQRVDARLSHHSDRVTDYIELGASGLFATSSFDHTIAVWDAASQRVAFVLEGHVQGVLTLDYMHSTLLSSGFEYQAYCWSIATRSLLVTLSGHQHRLIGAKFVSNRASASTAIAVTGDESGHFRLWDVSRCVRGSTSDLVCVLQSFELHTPTVCRFRTFACGVAGSTTAPGASACASVGKSAESELADIVIGNLRLFRFCAVTQAEESPPPRHVVYNTVANTFVGAVDGTVTVWNANSGAKVEEPFGIRDADVCGIVFDVPRERKLFVATSDGCVRLYNPITGMLMTKSQIHDGVISSLLFCPRTCCLISTGYDRNICVSHSTAGKTDVEVLRTVENAHESCITACAYSAELDLVATGDDAGCIQVYDFQKLYLLFRCESHKHEIRALHFHVQAPLLVSGDSSGVVYIWQATGVVYTASPLMRLALHMASPEADPLHTPHAGGQRAPSPATTHAKPLSNMPPVTSICSTPESPHALKPLILVACESGDVFGWDFRVIVSVARKRAVAATHFEYHIQPHRAPDTAAVGTSGTGTPEATRQHDEYNPLLRVAHKQSVLRLRPEDRNGGMKSSSNSNHGSGGRAGFLGGTGAVLKSVGDHASHAHDSHSSGLVCTATLSWTAHNDAVLGLKCVPDPGLVFTSSQDGTIKVWDAMHERIGTISTLDTAAKRRQAPHAPAHAGSSCAASSQAGTPSSSSPQDGASAWKFTRHPSADASHRHARIATEVIRKHMRRKQKKRRQAGLGRSAGASGVDAATAASVESGDSGDAAALTEAPRSPAKKNKLTGIDAILASQLPFSNESVRAGVQQGLFGPLESRQLREIAHSPIAMSAVAKKSALAPLLLAPEHRASKKRSTRTATGSLSEKECGDLVMMRTMTNFPLEMQRRSATRCHAMQALDIAPSPFLLAKLAESPLHEDARRGAKSTPKRTLKMRVDANVVVMRNVSLPKLLETPVAAPAAAASAMAPEIADTRGSSSSSTEPIAAELRASPLKASASAPALSVFSHPHHQQQQQQQQQHTGAETASAVAQPPPADDAAAKRNNIERKLKLYEDIVAGSVGASESSDQSRASKRLSQPYIPVWKTSMAAAASPTGSQSAATQAAMKRKTSHGVLPSTAASSSSLAHNPFGPFYTVKQVIECGNILTRFDEDFSGDIDQQEWMSMLQSFRPLFGQSDQEATEKLFRSLDRDDSGRISLHEILSALFSKATPDQLQKMKLFLRTQTDGNAQKKPPEQQQ